MSSRNLDQLYRRVIMDHYKHPRNRGTLSEDGSVVVNMNNPTCGDKIQIHLKLDGDKISDVKYTGEGCSISQSSASMMTEAIKGLTIDQFHKMAFVFSEMVQGRDYDEDIELGDAEALQGVSQFPARIKCATLAWKAMEKALREHETQHQSH
ncbi:SUF system NifU family Fe-S cluster assembly protein [Terrilactibacillus sp. S3-3]|nr:SUF system NifU family Fe-S cluster assembly protein [Terrilactibacillus sp. S3-3]